jgi:hypothetical protein
MVSGAEQTGVSLLAQQDVEVTGGGKHGKTMKLFSHPSPSPWKSLRRFPHSHRLDDYGHEYLPKQPMRWGQIRRAKGARSSRQNHSSRRIALIGIWGGAETALTEPPPSTQSFGFPS